MDWITNNEQQEEAKRPQEEYKKSRRRPNRAIEGEGLKFDEGQEESNYEDIDELLKKFEQNPKMFYADISPDFNLNKKPLKLYSKAGSWEEIFQFIKSNALQIFGTASVTFSNKGLKNLTACINQDEYPILSISFDVQNCQDNDNCTYIIIPNMITGDQFLYQHITQNLDETQDKILA